MGGEYHGPKIPIILNIIGLKTKGCANTYKVLSSHEGNVLRDVQLKWSSELNGDILIHTIETAFQNLRKDPSVLIPNIYNLNYCITE